MRVGRRFAADVRLPRHRMGFPGRRRHATLRKDLPRGLPKRSVVAHRARQARRFPTGLSRIRHRAGVAHGSSRCHSSTRRCFDHSTSGKNRIDDRQRGSMRRPDSRTRIAGSIRLGIRARSSSPTPVRTGRGETGHVTRIRRVVEGSEASRMVVRRPDHDVRVHAVDGSRERPSRGMRRVDIRRDGTISCENSLTRPRRSGRMNP